MSLITGFILFHAIVRIPAIFLCIATSSFFVMDIFIRHVINRHFLRSSSLPGAHNE